MADDKVKEEPEPPKDQQEALSVPKGIGNSEDAEVTTVAVVHATDADANEDPDSIVKATTVLLDATKETKFPPELPFDPGSLKVDTDTKKEPAIEVKEDDPSPKEMEAVEQGLEDEEFLKTTKSGHFPFEPGDNSEETNAVKFEDVNLQETFVFEQFPVDPGIGDGDVVVYNTFKK